MSCPWLSVIMPTYNGAAYLDHALESIARQREDGIEIIVVDDGSTDETRTILERHAHRIPLIVEYRGRIGSWTANSNRGLRLACADHVCFLHQDDLWLANRLRTLRPLLASGDEMALFLHPTRFIDTRSRSLGLWRCPLLPGTNRPEEMITHLLVQNFIAIPAPVFSRRAALEIGGLDEGLWYTADWDFWLKLAVRGPTIYHPRPLAAFRIHGKSQTVQGASNAGEIRRQLQTVLDRHLPQLKASSGEYQEICMVAQLSADLNHALADTVGGRRPPWCQLARQLLAVGLRGGHRFLRDSRIVERVLARIKARLALQGTAGS